MAESDHRGPRVALCGSTGLERFPHSLLDFVASLPTSTVILLRAPNNGEPGLFEQVMRELAASLWLEVEWFLPDPEEGKGATFLRDAKLARSADLVLAYFRTTTVIGGTAHVVEKAIDAETPVYAYGLLDGEESFRRVGEHDSQNQWGESVPG